MAGSLTVFVAGDGINTTHTMYDSSHAFAENGYRVAAIDYLDETFISVCLFVAQ